MSCSSLTRQDKRAQYNYQLSDIKRTWQELNDDLIRLGCAFFTDKIDIAGIEESLHDAWDQFIHAAKAIPATNAEHDRLVALILRVRELGDFSRTKQGTTERAIMPNGQRLWTDLPYFGQDLRRFWTNESTGLSITERANLASFTARLSAVGVCPIELAECGLWLFREALENYGSSETMDARIEHGIVNNANKSASALLPALVQWLEHNNYQLVKICVNASNNSRLSTDDPDKISPGTIALEANVPQYNFSLERWLFWRTRLGELYCAGDADVAKPARKCFEIMVSTGREIGIEIPGEKRYLEKLYEALDKELIAHREKGCVGPEDIEIDPSWVSDDVD